MFGPAKLLIRCVPRGGTATPRTVLRRYATEPPPSLEQITSLLNSNPALAGQLVKSVNADCSQQIVTAAITRVNPDYIFSKQDTNKDGMVSKEEFTRCSSFQLHWIHLSLDRQHQSDQFGRPHGTFPTQHTQLYTIGIAPPIGAIAALCCAAPR